MIITLEAVSGNKAITVIDMEGEEDNWQSKLAENETADVLKLPEFSELIIPVFYILGTMLLVSIMVGRKKKR